MVSTTDLSIPVYPPDLEDPLASGNKDAVNIHIITHVYLPDSTRDGMSVHVMTTELNSTIYT